MLCLVEFSCVCSAGSEDADGRLDIQLRGTKRGGFLYLMPASVLAFTIG